MPAYKRNQPVRLLAFVGPTFDHDWSEKGTIVRPADMPADLPDWYIVRYTDGGKMCVHSSRIMPSNA